MDWRRKRGHEDCAEIGSLLKGSWTDAIIEGMRFGCSVGTACVTRPGASIPAPKEEIDALLNAGNEVEEDEVEVHAESHDESYDESYDDSAYSDSDRSYDSSCDDYSDDEKERLDLSR